jgi:ubiquinone/menaquinone biosynthesis C-methylase UbiE
MKQFSSFEEENIAYWSNRAPGYSAVNQEELATNQRSVWGSVLHDAISSHCAGKLPTQISVLDVGTGPGFFAIILAEMGYQVTAVDYTEAMLVQAKENAGSLDIAFRQMNAQNLTFPDGKFDVVISRNLTWNLNNPQSAYTHWARVLKPGGLLLNFDANWYSYLYDEKALQNHLHDRENLMYSDVRDETAGTDVDAMEAIAYQTPLAKCYRPEWDRSVLTELGMTVTLYPDIWKTVWTREERINNASTPMFLIHGVKNVMGGTVHEKICN